MGARQEERHRDCWGGAMRRAGRTPGDAGTRRRGRIKQKVSDGRLAVPMWLRPDPSSPRLTIAHRRCTGYRGASDCGSAP